ncbi:MAG: tRNA delta(2)-isopentenylpyrophosphate transferase [Bryobacterales bacterium]|nr:tRNA delta(2)-isopentenylpyrophosphate transferase [Bryobacterales bacterium]
MRTRARTLRWQHVERQNPELQDLIIVVGPTASGKSELALRIAETFSGEIVNCDALQLYRGFDIGTAKTPAAARRGVPHHLFDVLDPQKGFSAGDYARSAREAIAAISSRGCLPVVTGGTGFYLRALLDGLPALPSRDESLRERLSGREQRRPGSLHRLLRRLEPSAASRIHARDIQKTTRALEIRLLTRTGLPEPSSARPLEGFRVCQIGLAPERSLLADAIAARTRHMFEAGLVEEVRTLLDQGLSGEEKPFESLGYKQVLAYLRGQMSLEQAMTATEIETRQYAKRQQTWFRRDPRVAWLPGFGSDPVVAEAGLEVVRKFLSE